MRGRVAQIVQRLRAQNTQLPPQADIERQVIEAMIVERSQLQMAKEMGVRVADRELDAAIGRIAEGQKMSVQDMRNQMEKEGLTFAAFREEIRNEIMLQRLREHEVDAKIQVSDAEVDTYLAAEKAAASEKVELDIAQILVGIPANATPEQIAARRARADEVARQLRTGADFAKIAATYSDAPDALEGRRHRLARPGPPAAADRRAAAQTQPGPGHACHQEQYRLPHPQADRQAQPGAGAGAGHRPADPRAPHPDQGHARPCRRRK